MILLDANILLYAYDSEATQHAASAKWLHRLMRGPEIVGIPWQTIWAFVRIRTNIRLVRRPQPPEATFQIVREWLTLPGIVTVQPGPLHAKLLEKLVVGHQATGPLLSDAVLAALAIEHGAVLASTDRDFSRFPDIRWVNPLESDV